jgi:hypothetical protein
VGGRACLVVCSRLELAASGCLSDASGNIVDGLPVGGVTCCGRWQLLKLDRVRVPSNNVCGLAACPGMAHSHVHLPVLRQSPVQTIVLGQHVPALEQMVVCTMRACTSPRSELHTAGSASAYAGHHQTIHFSPPTSQLPAAPAQLALPARPNSSTPSLCSTNVPRIASPSR